MVTLVIEGGASRAVYASGVAESLQRAGLVPDAIYGTSAGGAIAAWYAAGQAHVGTRTWDRVTDRELLSYRRMIQGIPAFDFRKLYHEVYPTQFGMDVDRLRAASYPVIVTMTDADTAETVYADLRHAATPWELLHATSAIPFASEAPVTIDGRRLLDGGVTAPIPIERALADGHRDVLVISNRPRGERAPESTLVLRLLERTFPALVEPTRQRHRVYGDALRLAEHPPDGARVRLVRPTTDLGVSRFTRDVEVLHRAIDAGREDGARAAEALGLARAA